MELHTYLSMVTPWGKLTDLPTFKEKVRQQESNVNYGLVGYPILMTADIVLYKTDVVPVGVDQAPHIEFARETVRSFNYRYGTNVLREPQMKNTEIPRYWASMACRRWARASTITLNWPPRRMRPACA